MNTEDKYYLVHCTRVLPGGKTDTAVYAPNPKEALKQGKQELGKSHTLDKWSVRLYKSPGGKK